MSLLWLVVKHLKSPVLIEKTKVLTKSRGCFLQGKYDCPLKKLSQTKTGCSSSLPSKGCPCHEKENPAPSKRKAYQVVLPLCPCPRLSLSLKGCLCPRLSASILKLLYLLFGKPCHFRNKRSRQFFLKHI